MKEFPAANESVCAFLTLVSLVVSNATDLA